MKLSEIKENWPFIENIGSISYWLEQTDDGSGKTIGPEEVLEIGCQLEAKNANLISEVAGMRDKWTPPDEVAELQLDLSKPPGERKYCAGCSLPKLERLIDYATHKPGCHESGNECICGLDVLLTGDS